MNTPLMNFLYKEYILSNIFQKYKYNIYILIEQKHYCIGFQFRNKIRKNLYYYIISNIISKVYY